VTATRPIFEVPPSVAHTSRQATAKRRCPIELTGNTTGLSPSERSALERIFRRRVPPDRIASPELARSLAESSAATGRQVGVLVHRTGAIEHVIVGDAHKLMLPDIGRLRAAAGRFRGLRLVHTHLRGEPLTHDDLVDLTRLRLDLVAAIHARPDGTPGDVYWAHLLPENPEGKPGAPRAPSPFTASTATAPP
jgi:GTP-binding protein HflX